MRNINRIKHLFRQAFMFSEQLKATQKKIEHKLNNKIYGLSSRMGGSSKDGIYDEYSGKFKNEAIQNFKQCNRQQKQPLKWIPGSNVITTKQECLFCVQKLMQTNTIVAWDTETIDLDIKNEAPVDHGRIIGASFFAGPQYNFGNGPRVFIDNFGTNAGLINYFKDYLQNDKYKKVWHNYGFDRHIFYNHGINVKGFGGDTMHMARLYDSGKLPGGYSLASLTKQYNKVLQNLKKKYLQAKMKQIVQKIGSNNIDPKGKQKLQEMKKTLQSYQNYHDQSTIKKTKMMDKFRRKKILKNNQQGLTYEFPSILTLHTSQQYIKDWIQYSILDSQSTFFLRQLLQHYLKKEKSTTYPGLPNMWVLYEKYWLPFGQVLTDMQRQGFKINMEHMQKITKQAMQKMYEKQQTFLKFIKSFQNGANIDLFNPSSPLQLQQLLHAPYDIKLGLQDQKQKDNKRQRSPQQLELIQSTQSPEQHFYEPKGARKPVNLSQEVKQFIVDNDDPKRGKKKIMMQVKGFGIPPQKLTPLGLPSVDQTVLHVLAGNPTKGKYGKAYEFFELKGDPQFGKRLCQALQILIQYRSTQTLLKTFILPLKQFPDKNGRIHCSLNINTQTGRLSARKPNLQNQPALQKDVYKIRQAFQAQKGKKLIVADYGQLELRVLAHLTNCKSMLTAFKQGGDFHSRTAIGMFPYIKQEIQNKTILLEWDKSQGEAPVPLLKQKYASQRKKAKTVNFSIAYGKSAQGFAEDWNCSLQQAKKIIEMWFSDRPEVKKWQQQKQLIAQKKKYTQTLLGRFRKLDKFFESQNRSFIGMWKRRAINTPIQGGAADIVIAAMIKIWQDKRLKQLGWKLLMQIHDQLILQGPEQSAQQAFAIVKQSMSHPFQKDLLVDLQVDAKIGNNWYECK